MHGIMMAKLGKWRLILDPDEDEITESTAKTALSYMSVDDIAARVMLKGRGALLVKFDLKEAYSRSVVVGNGVEGTTLH